MVEEVDRIGEEVVSFNHVNQSANSAVNGLGQGRRSAIIFARGLCLSSLCLTEGLVLGAFFFWIFFSLCSSSMSLMMNSYF